MGVGELSHITLCSMVQLNESSGCNLYLVHHCCTHMRVWSLVVAQGGV